MKKSPAVKKNGKKVLEQLRKEFVVLQDNYLAQRESSLKKSDYWRAAAFAEDVATLSTCIACIDQMLGEAQLKKQERKAYRRKKKA